MLTTAAQQICGTLLVWNWWLFPPFPSCTSHWAVLPSLSFLPAAWNLQLHSGRAVVCLVKQSQILFSKTTCSSAGKVVSTLPQGGESLEMGFLTLKWVFQVMLVWYRILLLPAAPQKISQIWDFWDLGVVSGSQGLLNLEHLVADVELFVGLQRQSENWIFWWQFSYVDEKIFVCY